MCNCFIISSFSSIFIKRNFKIDNQGFEHDKAREEKIKKNFINSSEDF